ncbi:MAG: asparagine synthase (glutamine-hydrolyzing) [Vicinamibacterales bacterium]
MCGIAGAVFWDGPRAGVYPDAVIRRMTSALEHRGPDGEGAVRCVTPGQSHGAGRPLVMLGHRRLSIIDLSPRAAQPMASGRTPSWLTYNGEVYNYKALQRELKDLGRTFHSDSDTEVVLQGYEQWGARVVDRLHGMFALGIWDGRTQELLLARDRLGIKPLYTFRTADALLFASEIRSLLASGMVPRRLDQIALDQFLAYQTVPQPRTLVEGVRLVAPGHFVLARGGGQIEERCFWDLIDAAAPDAERASPAEIRARIGELLRESAALHLVSDVPVGTFLSGGIDSSALVALVRSAGVTPRTFSVTFPGTSYDEGPGARAVATAFGAEHTDIPMTESDLLAQLPEALACVDHPSGDGINSFTVSRAVREAGVKVALSGLGGDELFGGYPSFRRMERLDGFAGAWRWTPSFARKTAASAIRAIGSSSVAAAKAAALLESGGTLPEMFPIMRQLFSREQRTALLGSSTVRASAALGDPYVQLLQSAVLRRPDIGVQTFVSYAEARTYMHDVLLRDTDQMSMAHGLEVRVPLLDHRLVEYVMSLPDSVKRSNGFPKRLLVESLGTALPEHVTGQPKRGFVFPFDPWMRGSLRPLCEHHLGSSGLAGRGVFDPTAIQSIWQSFLGGESRVTWSRPWALVALNAWLERTGVTA